MAAEFLCEASKRVFQAAASPATVADVEDAASFQLFMATTCDFLVEQVLGAVIGLFYTTELFSASSKARSDCVAHLPDAGVEESQLDFFVAFGKHVLRDGLQGLGNGPENENMVEEMENLWWDFCTSRSVQVDATLPIKYPVLPPEDEAELFSYPFRDKLPKKKRTLAKKSVSAGSDASGSHEYDWPSSVPKFFELAHRILHSHYFLCLPLENVGYNYRRFCEETGNAGGWKKAYSDLAQTEVVIPEDEFRGQPESSFPLPRSQLKRLVEQLRCHDKGTLFRALITARPPLSMLPHLYAVMDCTVHARLWLLGIDLTIYMESPLTYAELGSGRFVKEEQKVYEHIYLQERVPSSVELLQRQHGHSHLCASWGPATEVLVLRPSDYDALGAPDDEMWRAVREHIRFSIPYTEGEEVDPGWVFQDVVCIYRPLLDVDRKWRRLHPSLGSSHLSQPVTSTPSPRVVFHK